MVTLMSDWDIAVGETLLRRELHDRWGGGRYGGMGARGAGHECLPLHQAGAGQTIRLQL